ncbi:MAG TPA: hypothetical protein VF188_07345 [Longimicrobiales bacterium]
MPATRADPRRWGLPADAVELPERRTRGAKHFDLGNGRYQAVIGRRLHFQATPGGPWLDPQELVVQRSAPGTWTVTTAEISIQANYSAMTLTHLPTNTSWQWVFQGTGSGDAVIYNGVPWQYEPSPWGVKSNAVVESRRGPQTYDWLYLSNAQGIHVDDEGNIRAGQFLIRRPFVIGANGVIYQCSAWDLSVPAHARFSFDDSTLPPEAFPYRIDPTTTLSVAASGDDGEVSASSAAYPPTSGSTFSTNNALVQAMRRFRTFPASGYDVAVCLFRFDTSSLAGATVNSATFRAVVTSRASVDARNITIEWYPASNWPIDISDWTNTAGTSAHAGTAITSLTLNADNDFTLSNPDANINKSGYTGFRVHVDGGQPTGSNAAIFSSFDDTTHAGPRLIVDYTTFQVVDGAATLSGTGTLAASAIRVVPASAALTGSDTLAADGLQLVSAAATLSGTSTLAAVGGILVDGAATLAGAGTLTAAGDIVVDGAATLTGLGTLAAGPGERIVEGAALLAADGTLVADGRVLVLAGGTLVGVGVLTAAGWLLIDGAAVLTGAGSLTASGARLMVLRPPLRSTAVVSGRTGSTAVVSGRTRTSATTSGITSSTAVVSGRTGSAAMTDGRARSTGGEQDG